MSAQEKAIPKPTELDLEFYQSITATGDLHIQRCKACGTCSHPPRYYCPNCFSGDFEFDRVTGDGFVYSFTVSHFSVEPAWQAEIPYVTVVVELDEGPRLVGAGRGFDPSHVEIGARVRVVPEKRTDDFAFLWVEPA